MAFTEMNNVDHDLGEEKPPDRNGNRTFMIIAGVLGGIMVLALLCIAGLALFQYLPGQRAAQSVNATNEALASVVAIEATQSAAAPLATNTQQPTTLPPTNTPPPTNTTAPTNTPGPTNTSVISGPTQTATFNAPMATIYAMRTQRAQYSPTPPAPTSPPVSQATSQPTSQPTTQATSQPTLPPAAQATLRPTTTALPTTGIGDELGTPGLLMVSFVLVAIIFLMRKLRTAS